MGVCVPEEYGGAGTDFISYMLVLEELSRADAGVGVTVAVHTSAVHAADPGVRNRGAASALRAAARSRRQVGAFALTEPESGSDAGALRTRRRPTDDGWHIGGDEAVDHERGVRRGVAHSSRERTVDARRANGVCAFVLDAGAGPVTRDEEKLGLNSLGHERHGRRR